MNLVQGEGSFSKTDAKTKRDTEKPFLQQWYLSSTLRLNKSEISKSCLQVLCVSIRLESNESSRLEHFSNSYYTLLMLSVIQYQKHESDTCTSPPQHLRSEYFECRELGNLYILHHLTVTLPPRMFFFTYCPDRLTPHPIRLHTVRHFEWR